MIVGGPRTTFPKLNAHHLEKLLTQYIGDGYELYLIQMHDSWQIVIMDLKLL